MREDVHQRELEDLSASLLGMEDALFFPTCTMANQVALMLRCRPGVSVLADEDSHLAGVEAAATAGVSGVPIIAVAGRLGHLTPRQVAEALGRRQSETQMPIGLVWLENTHNVAGGTVMPEADFSEVTALCRIHGVPVHVDGARLWNAVASRGRRPDEVVSGADSVAFSLNKVLAAPLGAILAGSGDLIARAIAFRNMLGGGWRPTGILAAAGTAVLRENRARVAEDHTRAASLADVLSAEELAVIDRDRVQTNIVVAHCPRFAGTRAELIQALAAEGVLVTPHSTANIRMVTHIGIDDQAIEFAVRAFRKLASECSSNRH